MAQVKTSELVKDPAIHPRQGKLDPLHVQRLIEVLQAGGQLPPIIACDSTRKIVSGWHRTEAVERMYGADEAEIEVEWRKYKNDAERYEDALRESADSKLALSHFNQQSCVLRADELGIPFERVAAALGIPGESLQRRIITAHAQRRNGALTPLKSPFRHLAGGVLTSQQETVNNSSDGRKVTWHADQILRPLKADMLPLDDPAMVIALLELRDALMNESRLVTEEAQAG